MATNKSYKMQGSHSKGEVYLEKFMDGKMYISTKIELIAQIVGTSRTEKQDKANGERIVKCWNDHEELRESLRSMIHIVEKFRKENGLPYDEECQYHEAIEILHLWKGKSC